MMTGRPIGIDVFAKGASLLSHDGCPCMSSAL